MDGFTRYICSLNNKIFQIDISLDQTINKVTILGSSDLNWIDVKIDDHSFKREIGKSTIYFLDGEIVLQKLQLNRLFNKREVNKKKFLYFHIKII
jgi:hypothetical protein